VGFLEKTLTIKQFKNKHLEDYLKSLKAKGEKINCSGSFASMAQELKRVANTNADLKEHWSDAGGGGGPLCRKLMSEEK
jgi:uncharacterized membrane-anchored protein YhcB (DUF1043 family)